MNIKYNQVSEILNENDYLGPHLNFKPNENEMILFQLDNVSHIEDERTFLKFENLDPRGILLITNQRVFFQPQFFTIGKQKNTEIPIDKIVNLHFKFSKIVNRNLEVHYNENGKYKKDTFWTPFRRLREAYDILLDIIKKPR